MGLVSGSRSLAIACVLLFCLHPEAQIDGKAPEDSVFRRKTTVPGRVIWDKPCVGLCAAGRYPRFYKFVDDDSVFKSVGDVLQELGFALNPKGLKPKEPQLTPESKETEVRFYWTDLIPLDDDTLKKVGTTRAALRLSDDAKIFYAIQVALRCSAHNPLYEAAVSDPRVTRQEIISQFGTSGTRSLSAETEVEFAFSLLVKKRGAKSTYVDESSEYDNRPILDWLYKKIAERIHELKPEILMDAETGGLMG
jgi:hypothetical protein